MGLYLYMTIVLGILMITTVWIMLDDGIAGIVFPSTQDYIANKTSSEIGDRTASTLTLMESVWNFFPALTLLGLVMWGFVESQRK